MLIQGTLETDLLNLTEQLEILWLSLYFDRQLIYEVCIRNKRLLDALCAIKCVEVLNRFIFFPLTKDFVTFENCFCVFFFFYISILEVQTVCLT